MADYKLRYKIGAGEIKEIVFAPEGLFDFEDFTVSATAEGSRRTVKITAKAQAELIKCTQRGVAKANVGDRCFINGYQSWTKTKEYFLSEKEHNVNSIPKPLVRSFSFDRYGDTTFYDFDKNLLHGYDVFFVKENGAFIFNANVKTAYLIILTDRRTGEISLSNELVGLTLSAGESATVSDYYIENDYEKGLALFDSVYPKRPIKKTLGYTSWYNYYQNVNEEIILRDLDAIDSRFDLFQIDDGYETFVGDWLDVDANKFPNGLKPIVDKIHSKNLSAGIWLAPFVAESKSKVFLSHPDWFDFDGETVKCGSNWSGFFAFNLQKEGVKEYIARCLRYYVDLGFDFFKLDFLYAASLPLYKGKTRSQVAEDAYSFLREILGDKVILGCGATLFNGAMKFDYMRIGPDVSLKFDDVFYMRFMHNERISTKITLQNTVYRSFMNGRLFGNDPDVFLLRDNNISLNKKQKIALLTLNALFGSVIMTSDNIAEYDDEKKSYLSAALELFRHAEVKRFSRKHDIITVDYELSGKTHTISYNYKKGVIL